jgi:hypothetical protein
MNVIPSVGVSGLWSLASPFNSKLLPNIPYTCIAIRKLSDVVAAGGNPEADYYAINGLDNNRYISDLNNGACIITLQGGSSSIVYVPSTSINNYPDIGGVPYTVLALAINLGAIPDSLDLSYLKYRVGNLVRDTVGIQPNINVVAISPTTLVNDRDAKAIEAARLANIGTVVTDYAKYLQAAAERDSARQKIQELEHYIMLNMDKLLSKLVHVTPAEIAAYTPDQIATFSNIDMEALNAAQLAAMSPAQIALFSPSQMFALSCKQLRDLSIAQIQALSSIQISSINLAAIKGLTSAQIAALTSTQLTGLTTNQLAAMSFSQLQAFTQAQISVFTSAQLDIYNSNMQADELQEDEIYFTENSWSTITSVFTSAQLDIYNSNKQVNALQEDELYFTENSWSTIINEGDILYMSQQ